MVQEVHGNMAHAMRDNYNEHGVDEYYKKVASSYCNPFFPGIKKVIWTFMNRWWEEEGKAIFSDDDEVGRTLKVLDMAAGSGEATICLLEWEQSRRPSSTSVPPINPARSLHPLLAPTSSSNFPVRPPFIPPNARRGAHAPSNSSPTPTSFPKSFSGLEILATDPYTVPAYSDRTSRPCLPLSFSDIASGELPDPKVYDLVICSFALHLVDSPSELFALLYEISSRAKWLVVIAPHKKPEIKETWGWARWDLMNWKAAGQAIYAGGKEDEEEKDGLEIVIDKVKLRLYRSTNDS